MAGRRSQRATVPPGRAPCPGGGLLRQARAEALLEELEQFGYLIMDDHFYISRLRAGWRLETLDQAAEDLAAAGLAELQGAYGVITLWPAGTRERSRKREGQSDA